MRNRDEKKPVKPARRIRPGAGIVISMALMLGLPAVEANAWEWTLVPYLWASDITMDVSLAGEEVIGVDIEFTDLVDKLDGAFSFRFEGRQGQGGFFFDLTLIALSDSSTQSGEGALPLPPDTQLDVDLDLTILEAGGFWRVTGDDRTGLDLLGGVRYIAMDQQIDITLPAPGEPSMSSGTDEAFTDVFFGVRYSGRLGEKWTSRVRLDYGFGDTDGALNALAGVGYNWGQNQKYGLILAYQRLDLELVEKTPDGRSETNLTMSGPKLGFRITWGG